jgi:Tol biopolymer transport system component
MKKKFIVGVLIVAIAGAIVAFNLFYKEEKIPTLTETQIKNKIVFVSGGNILMANENGTDLVTIAKGEKPTFSPDGKKLAFLTWRSLTFEREVYLIDLEKGGKTKIYGGLVNEFKFSPDSQRIALVSTHYLGDKKYSYDLIIIDLQSNKVLTILEGWNSIGHFSWSPDGKRITFEEIEAEKIFIINSDGTNLTELTEGREPTWSPKEEKIAFIKRYGIESEIVMELFVIDLTNGNITKIAENAASPSWSPDGKKIAFLGFEYKRNEYGNVIDEIRDIFVVDIETGNVTKLTKGDPNIWISGPLVWSSDGKKIAFKTEPKFGGDIEIYLVNIEDKSIKNISNNPKVQDTDPCFPP